MKKTINKTLKTNLFLRLFLLVLPLSSACLIGATAAIQAATLLVYNTNDHGPGSLRQAINDNNALGGGYDIIFSNIVTGTITLTTGELLITKDVTILGPGPRVLSINGNAASGVFQFTNMTATVSGLTITNGAATSTGFPANSGGGIAAVDSTLTVSNCVISGNSAANYGGGIMSHGYGPDSAHLSVIASTVSSNSAHIGGGIYTARSLEISNVVPASVIIASTVSSNYAVQSGAGIFNDNRTLSVIACTISGNLADFAPDGGINNEGGTLEIGDTILKAGSSGVNIYNFSGTVNSLGYNICSDGGVVNVGGGTGSLTGVGDQINTDPMLGPLQDNGGPTPTQMPLTGSPAIDQGKNLADSATDQRGHPRVYDDPAIINATLGDGSDIGAVEVNSVLTLLVFNTNNSGTGSLRQAIADAGPGDTVSFASGVTGTITLTSGELLISKSVAINGPGAKVLAVNGNATSRMFHITNGVTASISGLAMTNGAATDGGGIYNDHSTLTVSNCTVSGNSAANLGGGLFSDGRTSGSASLSVIASTLGGNSASYGGGIFSYGLNPGNTTLSVLASTLSGNSASKGGGGLYNHDATLTLTSSTLSSNSAANSTGGSLQNVSGPAEIGDTILKASDPFNNLYNSAGTITSLGYNLSSDNGNGFLTNATDQTSTDPKLGPLKDNGGPTPTMALLSNSPAIDKGKSFGLTTDQRGAPRPFDFSSIANASGGDGSDIGAFELGSPKLNIQPVGGGAVLSWPSYYGDFSLQSSTNLTSSNSWITAGGAPVVVGNQFQQTNSPISGSKFFRLKFN